MADILIHGISMPRERDHLTITINADGTVQPLVDMYCPIIAHAIELPEHGDLIDISNAENALFVAGNYHLNDYKQGWNDGIKAVIENAPVVIPSNREETE